jgi:glycosyltransferase involved in cell wall biosynthesis
MAAPLVSVIVPAYDGERFVAEAVESILGQTYSPLELIVVDDGSTDRTAEIVEGYEAVRLLRKENGGPASARNAGLEAATGAIIAFQDQDDVMLPRRIEVQAGRLIEAAEVDLVICDQEVFFEDGAPMPDWDRRIAPLLFGEDNPQETLVGSISLVARRCVFDEIGTFDEGIFGGDDLDWTLRALEAGFGFERLEEKLLRRRVHARNISQDAEVCRVALLQCFRKRAQRRRATA